MSIELNRKHLLRASRLLSKHRQPTGFSFRRDTKGIIRYVPMPKNAEGVFFVSKQFPFTFSCSLYGFIRSLHRRHQPRRLRGGPCTSADAQEMVLWILDRELTGRGRAGAGGSRWSPKETPRTAGVSPRESPGVLDLSAALQSCPHTSSSPPRAQGRAIGVSFLTPKPQPRLAVGQVHQRRFCTPAKDHGGKQCLPPPRSPSSHRSPQSRLYTHVPRPLPLPPAPGAAPGVPGLRAPAPSHPPQAPEPPRAAGPCLRLEQLPGQCAGLLGLPLGGEAPLRVFAPREDAAGRVILFLFTFFFSYTLNLNKVFFSKTAQLQLWRTKALSKA